VLNAARYRSLSGTTWRAMISEGLAMKRSSELTWSQILMAANTPMMTKAALVDGRTDTGVFPTGQVVGVIDDLPSCRDLIERIMDEADKVLTELTGGR
jgi:NAD(P)H-dependent flavin oxidoreductase YrpB (nitropropane dioxygenase family)